MTFPSLLRFSFCRLNLLLVSLESFSLAELKGIVHRHLREHVHRPGNCPCPAGLVTGAYTCTGVSVKILMEEDVIFPERINLKFLNYSQD